MTAQILKSRTVELLFGTGIPLVGFFSCCQPGNVQSGLLWMYPLLLVAGWHILVVNDIFFDRENSRMKTWQMVPVIAVPPLLVVAGLRQQMLVTMLFLIIINWNLYSYFGKRNWMSGLFHNFAGGFLHFLAGVAGAGGDIAASLPMAFFFAFAMTAGAMHHDAAHAEEDSSMKYDTGAVSFGAIRWWRLGIIPMLAAAPLLFLQGGLFMKCFAAACILYAVLYAVMYSRIEKTENMLVFRILCRLVFAAAAMVFIGFKLL